MVRHIDTAHAAGARLRPACEAAGITVRTLQRWRAENAAPISKRRAYESHALSDVRPRVSLLQKNDRLATDMLKDFGRKLSGADLFHAFIISRPTFC